MAEAVSTLVAELVQQGMLDDQFLQLMQLQDESNPDFVSEVVELYFEESSSKLERLGVALEQGPPAAINYDEVDAMVHQFKGSSANFGARQMTALCVRLRDACAARDAAACAALVVQLRERFAELKLQLQQFLELERRRKSGGQGW